MAIKFTFNGIPYEVSTPAEAAELQRLLRSESGKPPKKVRNVSQSNGHYPAYTVDESVPQSLLDAATAFLDAIDKAGDRGANADQIARALKVQEVKGIGSKSAQLNKLFKGIGLSPKSVYDNSKTAEGRFWKKGRKFDDAHIAVKTKLSIQ